jgi:tetratricopeptide (TPR) repeat protein
MADDPLAPAEPAPKPDFEVTAQRLATAINIARGGMSFIFAVCNSVPLRQKVLARLATAIQDALRVDIANPTDDAVELALQLAREKRPPVVIVTNLDNALLSPEHGPAALTALNASREIWWNRFACPVIFFVSDASLDRIVQAAPDLWSRKSHVFAFAEDGGQSIATPAILQSPWAQDIATWPHARRTARLVELQARLANLSKDDSAASHNQQARLLHEYGDLRRALGDLDSAREAFTDAARHAAQAADWQAYADSQQWAAAMYKELGDPAASAKILREAIARLSSLPEPDEFGIGGLYNVLALVEADQGDFAAARSDIERALALASNHLPPDAPALATTFVNLAGIQQAQGELDAARLSMERAIAIDSKHYPPDHPIFATIYSNLGSIQRDQGDLRAARANLERAIAINSKYFDANYLDLAISYSNLAMIQKDQGDLAGAQASIERAIAIKSKHFAPDDLALANSYSNLAIVMQDLGDLDGARASIDKAMVIKSKHLTPDHPAFATTYSNLALIQQDQGDLAGARASLERAIAIESKHFPPDHPSIAISYNNLAHICIAEGSVAAALALWRKAHLINLKALGPNHPYTKDNAAMLRKYDPPGP